MQCLYVVIESLRRDYSNKSLFDFYNFDYLKEGDEQKNTFQERMI